MDRRHDPSAARRILRDHRDHGLTRELLDAAQALSAGVYRAEALCGLCSAHEMEDADRRDWVPEIIGAMLEEERPWRLAECVGVVSKSASSWPKGAARRELMRDLVGVTGGLPAGDARVEALKAISGRVPTRSLPDLLMLAVENVGMEAAAAKPVLRNVVERGDDTMLDAVLVAIEDAGPDLVVRFYDILHTQLSRARRTIDPDVIERVLPHLAEAEMETVRIFCSHAAALEEIEALLAALPEDDEAKLRCTSTLAGRADRCGHPERARELLERCVDLLEKLPEDRRERIQKNLAKGFERLGDAERAAALRPEPREWVEEEPMAAPQASGHVIALVDTYTGAISNAHLRALARLAGLAHGFGLDIGLVGWPTDDLEDLCSRARVESRADGVRHLDDLREAGRIRLVSVEEVLAGELGHPIATTHRPRDGGVDLREVEGRICILMGLGRQGLPQDVLQRCTTQYELTGFGASLETAVAMGALAARLADL